MTTPRHMLARLGGVLALILSQPKRHSHTFKRAKPPVFSVD